MKNRLLLPLLLLFSSSQAAAGAVIAAPSTPVDQMDEAQVRRLFLGREHSINNVPVTLIYQKAGAQRETFERQVLGKSGAALNSYWSKLIFTGRAKAPEEVAGDAAVRARVANTPGAFGYVDDSAVDRSVKVVFRY